MVLAAAAAAVCVASAFSATAGCVVPTFSTARPVVFLPKTFSPRRIKRWSKSHLPEVLFIPTCTVTNVFRTCHRVFGPKPLQLLRSVPAKRLSGASYYCSHHLLHPAGSPGRRPAPTSLLLLHLSKESKKEKSIRGHDPNQLNTKRKEDFREDLETEDKIESA